MFNSKERRIEKHLKQKYDVSFKVTHIQKLSDGAYKYYANEKGNAKREFMGYMKADESGKSDTYIDALIAYKIGEEMTQELQILIPGVRVLAKPAGVRAFSDSIKDPEIAVDRWIEENYNNTLSGEGQLQGITTVLLVPEKSVENIVYEEYKSYIMSLVEGRYEKLNSLTIEGVYVYDSDIILENLNQKYGIGDYDILDLEAATIVPEFEVELEVSQYASVLLGFRYLIGEFGNDYTVKFRYDEIRETEHE